MADADLGDLLQLLQLQQVRGPALFLGWRLVEPPAAEAPSQPIDCMEFGDLLEVSTRSAYSALPPLAKVPSPSPGHVEWIFSSGLFELPGWALFLSLEESEATKVLDEALRASLVDFELGQIPIARQAFEDLQSLREESQKLPTPISDASYKHFANLEEDLDDLTEELRAQVAEPTSDSRAATKVDLSRLQRIEGNCRKLLQHFRLEDQITLPSTRELQLIRACCQQLQRGKCKPGRLLTDTEVEQIRSDPRRLLQSYLVDLEKDRGRIRASWKLCRSGKVSLRNKIEDHKMQLQEQRKRYQQALSTALQQITDCGSSFLVKLEEIARGRGASEVVSLAWAPARMVGSKLLHGAQSSTFKIEAYDWRYRTREAIGDQTLKFSGIADKSLADGSVVADCVHTFRSRVPSYSAREACAELLDKLLRPNELASWCGWASPPDPTERGSDQALHVLTSLGWEPEGRERSPSPLRSYFVETRVGHSLRQPVPVAALRRSAESLCKDVVATIVWGGRGFVEENEVPELLQENDVERPHSWRSTLSFLTVGQASYWVRALTQASREAGEALADDLMLAAKELNSGVHDSPAEPDFHALEGLLWSVLVKSRSLLGADLPWHFSTNYSLGTGNPIRVGTGWSHSEESSRDLLVLDVSDKAADRALVWNPAETNPVVVAPVFLPLNAIGAE